MTEKESPPHQEAGHLKGVLGKPGLLRALSYPFRQTWRAILYVDSAWARGHPELELFPTARDRRNALRRAMSKIMLRRPFWVAVAKTVALVVLLGLLATTVFGAIQPQFRLPSRAELIWFVPPLLVVLVIAGAFFGNVWMKRYVPELLRHELLDCGVPICVPCGYPLIGAPGPNCPECGRPFDEQVQRILVKRAVTEA
ncbi:MAG: hypothetical protein KAS72_09305 [Phycisphaerales bacterium]|nr:hypothetical protein [Phycisphaerales bacterium]